MSKEFDMIHDAMKEGNEITLSKWLEKSKARDSWVNLESVSEDRYTDLDQSYEIELEEYYSAATCDM